ncbi:MAG: L-dopachrome tautomerase-related protein [Cyanobacteria bacterium J06621_11]
MKKIIFATAIGLSLFASSSVFSQDEPYEIFTQPDHGPGNVAVSSEGRVFITLHQAFDPETHVVEVFSDGTHKPFPSEDWQNEINTEGVGFVAPLGIQVDQNNTLWVIDNGSTPPRLVGWDLTQDKLSKVLALPQPVTGNASFVNDVAIDLKHNAAYFADMVGDEGPAIIVADLDTHQVRRVLIDHPSVQAEPDAKMIIEGREVRRRDGQPHSNGLNPITLDHNSEWVYYGAMHGTSLYRIKTADLLNTDLSEEALGQRVERYGDKPVSDGITIDHAGNVYITDVTGMGIGVTKPDGSYELLFSDETLIWPDSLSIGPDNMIYAAINQLNRAADLNAGEDISEPPFMVIRFPALTDASVGR